MSQPLSPNSVHGHEPSPQADAIAREQAIDRANAAAAAAELRERMSVHPNAAPGVVPTLPPGVSQALLAQAKLERDAAAATARDHALETSRDGATENIPSRSSGRPEFGPKTDVIYVNGINTNYTQAGQNAGDYANEIHQNVTLIHASTGGIAADLVTCAIEKTDPSAAYAEKPERAVADALMKHVTGPPGHERFEGDVHFAAHSRGALIVQRGLELFESNLKARGMSDASLNALLKDHISAETFGGASDQMPSFVKAVHYVNDNDDVGKDFGQGSATVRSLSNLAAVGLIAGPAGGELVLGVSSKLLVEHPQGPVITEPARQSTLDPVASLIEGHDVNKYLQQRQPFERTYDTWRATTIPLDIPPELPPTGRGNHVVPPQTSMLDAPSQGDVQARLDILRTAGVTLPDVRNLTAFRDRQQSGSFVNVSPEWSAQHCGGGMYQTCNVQTDLGGVTPPEGVLVDRGRGGVVQTPVPGLQDVALTTGTNVLGSAAR